MNSPKLLQQVISGILVTVFLVGCGTPAATPTLPPTLPPPSAPTFPPPPAPTFPPPPSPTIPPPPPTAQTTSLFTLIQTTQVTPVGNYRWGAFSRIGYVPGRDRIFVTFNTLLGQPEGYCQDAGHAYTEYTTDMVATENMGLIHCVGGGQDTGGLFAGDNYYYTYRAPGPDPDTSGFDLLKYDAGTWKELARTFHALDTAKNDYGMWAEDFGDPMIALVNGQIDVSSTYFSPTAEPLPLGSYATHHQFFTTDLQFTGKRILSETPHINLSSMVFANGTYNFLTGSSLVGDLIVMRYDQDWNYLETKLLKKKSVTSEGVAFDGQRFYVSYVDVPCAEMFGCYMNVRLAAFDPDWNLLDDIAVTSFTPDDHKQPGRPSLALHDGRIYVCYDQDEVFSQSQSPTDADYRVYVKVYEVSGTK